MSESTARKPRRMLKKAVEQQFRKDMQEAIDASVFGYQPEQKADDVIELVKAGIRDSTYEPDVTFADVFTSWGGDPTALPGGNAVAVSTSEQVAEQPENPGAIAAAKAEVEEPIDDLADWLDLYRRCNAKIEEIKGFKEKAKDKIIERLGDKTDATINGKVVATYSWVNQTQFLKDKLKTDNPALVEQYTIPNPHRRFDLK